MSIDALRVLDKAKMLTDLASTPDHWRRATEIGGEAELPDPLSGANKIVWVGMGGSAFGGDLLRTVYGADLAMPMATVRDYSLPSYVDDKTLVIAASYSGNTEETLACVEQAIERNAKLLCVTTGGELLRRGREENIAHIRVPGGMQPRCGTVFLFVPILIALGRLGYLDSDIVEMDGDETMRVLQESATAYQRQEGNAARDLAQTLQGSLPVIYASNHIEAVALRWRTQINENAKTLAFHHVVPEMNHNEIVGWRHPSAPIKSARVIFLRDSDEDPRVATRLDVTRELLDAEVDLGGVREIHSRGDSLLSRAFHLIALGDFTSYFLALMNGIDPSPVERIERLKQRLADG